MESGEILEYLDWDSSFFGLGIARLKTNTLDRSMVQRIEQSRASRQPLDCIYFLADPTDTDSLRVAQEYGFALVDIRATLERRLGANRSLDGGMGGAKVRAFVREDLPALRKIARASHHNTRFYRDHHFSSSQCDKLYETWIEKSCDGDAHAVLVTDEGSRVSGYLTCHLRDSCGQIGLVAVAPEHRGTGLGGELVSAALQWFSDNHAATVAVVTQATNTSATRLYERAGFVTRSIQLWYHKWFQRPGA